ncbi:MAG TPA: MobF family relaxase, partial [Chthoniobacteraceae bacterium]
MFTRAKIYGGERYLKNHLSANDYYAEGERVTGQWVGRGAAWLGLGGEVTAEQFEALRENLRPGTSERLTPRTKATREPTAREARDAFRRAHKRNGSDAEVANFRAAMKPLPNRVAFYDFQCSAQKSVSLLAVLAGDDRLREAHKRAARAGFAELEQFAARQKNTAFSRGAETTGNLCAAAFTHDASRALDPQLHTHFVVANATRAAAGRWYALEECQMLKAIRYAGKVYQNELAREVKEVGYTIRETRDGRGRVTGFEVEGVSDELCARFSKRRAEIEQEIVAFEKRNGREPTVAEVSRITRETREVKLAEISTSAVRAEQRKQLTAGEWDHLQRIKADALRAAMAQAPEPAGQEAWALEASVAHLFERQSVAREHEILAEALNQALGSVELSTLKRIVTEGEAGLVALSSLPARGSEFATRRGLELERWSVAFVDATKGKCDPLAPRFEPSAALSPEQRETVRAILSMPDQIYSLRGVAGVGKTTTLREVHRGLAGRRVHYIAPTAAAAKVLQEEGFGDATTVDDFLQNVARRERIDGAVVICDEAGLKSNRQGAELLRLAQRHRLRVLFVGDVRQHVSVEAGDFLRVLETHSQLGRCEIREIRRQAQAPAYKRAVEQMAAGDARGGLHSLDALGWIKEGSADYLAHAAADYLRLTGDGAELDRCLVVAPTWAENFRLTDRIRVDLQQRGRISTDIVARTVFDSLGWTVQQKRNARNFSVGMLVASKHAIARLQSGDYLKVERVEDGAVWIADSAGRTRRLELRAADSFEVGMARTIEIAQGDKLLIRANDKRRGLINGQVLTVEEVRPDASIRTREGVTIPAQFRHWCHGYVVTSHKAQGRTCEHVVVAAEKLDAKAAYVACSRGKASCTVHTPDKERLLARLPEGSRRAALDALA